MGGPPLYEGMKGQSDLGLGTGDDDEAHKQSELLTRIRSIATARWCQASASALVLLRRMTVCGANELGVSVRGAIDTNSNMGKTHIVQDPPLPDFLLLTRLRTRF